MIYTVSDRPTAKGQPGPDGHRVSCDRGLQVPEEPSVHGASTAPW